MSARSALGRLIIVLGAVVAIAAVAGSALAWHYYRQGWRDQHMGYPPRPHGYAEIVDVFGQPCNDNASRNVFYWRAYDNGVWYPIYYHRKLGGGFSTNLDNDVKGHIINGHLDQYMRSGIWGYNCRTIRNGSAWSTHAWGIAVDVSSVAEPNGQCHSTVNYHHADIWRDHRWKWGLAWCDPMHFQYAADY
jgi:hypothetical protein